MAQTQTKAGRWRRFFGWFGRHKVTAVFTVLLLAGVLFWAISGIILQAQIRSERTRFNKAALKVEDIKEKITLPGQAKISYWKNCRHSNFGGIFEVDKISCDAEMKVIYVGVQKPEAQKITTKARMVLLSENISLTPNLQDSNPFKVAAYNFHYQGLNCFFDSQYYDQDTLPSERDSAAPPNGLALVIDVDCSGRAKLDYFPVTD